MVVYLGVVLLNLLVLATAWLLTLPQANTAEHTVDECQHAVFISSAVRRRITVLDVHD